MNNVEATVMSMFSDNLREKKNPLVSGAPMTSSNWDNYSCLPLQTSSFKISERREVLELTTNQSNYFGFTGYFYCFSPQNPGITSATFRPSDKNLRMAKLFSGFSDENIEFGLESAFSQAIMGLVAQNCAKAIDELKEIIQKKTARPELIGESLIWIGDWENPTTCNDRLELLRFALKNEDVCIRADAITAIKLLGAKEGKRFLEEALEVESIEALKTSINSAIQYLS